MPEHTDAWINLPKKTKVNSEDDDADIIVKIEGNTCSAASAREEILKIANGRYRRRQDRRFEF